MREGVEEKVKKIKMIVFDIDGVMTDGRIIFSSGGAEIKFFDVRDGFGIRLAHRVGLKTALITGRSCEANIQRAQELGIEDVYQDAHEKIEAYEEILNKHQLNDEEVCYVGDDLVDLPLMRRVGLGLAVAGAEADVTAEADYVTRSFPGRGAVREVVELILKTQGTWEKAVGKYFKNPKK
jgi:3-deoxy-D-manno-octulosonate 8-phosphate phosphatase (KDO 8-P phosphatase)